jgi:dolichol-phosphate mannosyltransferase
MSKPSLTVILPTKREAANLEWLFTSLHEALDNRVDELDILVVDTPTDDGTEELCAQHGTRYIGDASLGFADALRRGFQESKHELVMTMDADGSHNPLYIRWMLREIQTCDLVICSRYVPRGGQEASAFRYLTSLLLNWWVGSVCSMPIRDLSGGFKMYRRELLQEIDLDSSGFEIQCEIAINAFGHGFRIHEIPFCYHPRLEGRSKAAVVKYGLAFLFGSLRLRRYRNSRQFCDYDDRAYRSRIPMQQWWQRARYQKMIGLLKPNGVTLDVGCGSGRIITGWPKVIGIDLNINILRYLRHEERCVIHADAQALPIANNCVDALFCCEVAEHLPADTALFDEIARVLKPGGRAIISTPDYGAPWWPSIEWVYERLLPPATEHEHLTRYKRATLEEALTSRGLEIVDSDRMAGSILFMLVEKPAVTSETTG